MVNIVNQLIEDKVRNIRFFLNYPKMEIDSEDEEVQKFLNTVNSIIKNDVKTFKEVVFTTFSDEEVCLGCINAISEFQKAFNKNNIISIPIEFSQIIGLTDISYISNYNYDFNLRKRITLDDIFRKDVEFERIIQSYIMEEVYEILEKYSGHLTCDIYDLMEETIYICDDPVFYFNETDLVICISSFELTSRMCNLIEFPICFKNIKNMLSDYAIENIFWGR